MKQTLIYLSTAIALATGSAAFAQDTATETPKTDTAQQPAAPTDEQFPVAEENPEPQPGQLYVRETHGDWQVHCVKAAEDAPEGTKEVCGLYQLLKDGDGIDVAEINMRRLPKGGKAAAGVDFASPLGSLLTAQVVMRIDSGKAKRYPYNWCERLGCFSRFGLTQGEINNMKKGIKATFTIAAISDPKKPITLDMSLKGFTAAWNAIDPH